MKKIIDKIKQLMFSSGSKRTYTFIPGTQTVFPIETVDEEQWLKEFKVSYMHGWRSNPIYLD